MWNVLPPDFEIALITPPVERLRAALHLPGTVVLQFAFSTPLAGSQPAVASDAVVYTGTHDNDTTTGWYATLNAKDRNYVAEYIGRPIADPAWDMIRLAWSSVAAVAVAPLQDVLSLWSDARMNKPGVAEGNWRWRFRAEQFRPELINRLAGLTELFNRLPRDPKAKDASK